MLMPDLIFAETADGKEVACSVSLMPTFEPVAPQDTLQVVKDEKPESTILREGSEFHFIFIVDRSCSMCKCNRMQIAIDACVLFVQSLPLGCKFSVLSFGTSWS